MLESKCHFTKLSDLTIGTVGSVSKHSLGRCSSYPYLELYTFPDKTEYMYYSQCPCNEYDSLTRRHIRPHHPRYDPAKWAELQYLNKVEKDLLPIDYKPLTPAEVLASKVGPLKRRYYRAFQKLQSRHVVDLYDSYIKSFVKSEKIKVEKFEEGKPARSIQYRDFTYLFLMNMWLKPIYNNIHTCNELWFGQRLSTVILKGYNSFEIASILHEHWTMLKNPVAVCLDAKFWDSSLTVEALKHEHGFYDDIIGSRKFLRLLALQLRTKGRTKSGIKYKVTGTRLSGDYNTSDGNSKVNKDLLRHVLNVLAIYGFVFVLGDDNVLMIEREDLTQLLDYINNGNFLEYNIDMRLEKVAYEFEQIEFCQTSPVFVQYNGQYVYRMVRNPFIIMSKMSYVLKQYWQCLTRYMLSVALCELALNTGVPITQKFAVYLIGRTSGPKVRPLAHVERYRAMKEPTIELQPITSVTRSSLERAFGITVEQQLWYESSWAKAIDNRAIKIDQKINRYRNYHASQWKTKTNQNPKAP